MKWISAISSDADVNQSVPRLAREVLDGLDGAHPDLVLVFVSAMFEAEYPRIHALVREHLPGARLAGCSANGVIGRGLELEEGPAISITAAVLPGVTVHPFHRDLDTMPDTDASQEQWRDWLGVGVEPAPDLLLIADPFADLATFLEGLDYAYPNSRKLGGLASGAGEPRRNALFLDDTLYDHGVCGVALSGAMQLDTIIAQGCRPIGPPATITSGADNLITTIDRIAAVDFIEQINQSLSPEDQKRLKSSLFIGLGVDDLVEGDGSEDYLIRNLVGLDFDKGSLVVGAPIEMGQRIQFHLRDREASRQDLERRLDDYVAKERIGAAGLLLFSCLGRGQYLYRSLNHDSELIAEKLGPLPGGGFFCNGEIGPVGGTTYIHGYTSVIGILRPDTP